MPDERNQGRARFGWAGLIGCGLLLLLGLAFVTHLGISSLGCMDSQGDNLGCALRLVGLQAPLYLAGVGLIALITYVVRRVTR